MKLDDLKQYDDLFYVGDITDVDGSGWVTREEAELILLEYNTGTQQ